MESSGGFGGGVEEGDVLVYGPENLGDIIQEVIDNFERNRMAVDAEVIEYIRTDVIIDERGWATGLREGRIDARQTQAILAEALEEGGKLADRDGQPTLDIELARSAFHAVIEDRWECVYPFLLC